MTHALRGPLVAATVATLAAGCATAAREAPVSDHTAHAPAAGSTVTSTQQAARRYTDADVRFMQHMIAHHAQALVMAAMVPERTRDPRLHLVAERITRSQEDEIALMRRWLTSRGEEAPSGDAHAMMHAAGDHAHMPGMLSMEELEQLAATSGRAFDRLFLESMIRHHEGALVMVGELFATPGAAQEGEIYNLASEVDADQRAEIARMQALLASLDDAGQSLRP